MHELAVRHAISKAFRVLDNALNPSEYITEQEKLDAIPTLYP